MTEVKHLVQQWRDTKELVRTADETRERARKQLSDEDAEHVAAVSQWDEQRAGLSRAIADIRRSVSDDGARAAAAQREADAAMAAAVDQRERNADHRAKLTAHLQNLHNEAARIEQRDAAAAQQLLSFRVERERTRMQLHAALDALRQALPAEREATARAIEEASQRKEAARRQLEADRRRWAATVAQRLGAQHAKMVAAVSEERESAAGSRGVAKRLRAEALASAANDQQLIDRVRAARSAMVARA